MLRKALAALLVITLPFGAYASKGNVTMDDKCVKGKTLFYGKMTKTGSEEKLCEVAEGEFYFWTRNGDSKDIIGTKVTSVKKVEVEGTMGKTLGYDFNLTPEDVIGLRALYKHKSKSAEAGFIIINQSPVTLEPNSIIFN